MNRLALLALLALAIPAQAQRQDPNLAHPHEVLTVKRDGHTVSGLASWRKGEKAWKHGIALFPGHPGILKLREEGGEAKYELRGNFLMRSRRHWLDGETLVMAVDAPSDQWASFYQEFRETPRYGADIGALVAAAAEKYGIKDWTFIGTSEGSVSAFHAARMNPALARRRRRRSEAASRCSACAAAAAGRAAAARPSPRTASSARRLPR